MEKDKPKRRSCRMVVTCPTCGLPSTVMDAERTSREDLGLIVQQAMQEGHDISLTWIQPTVMRCECGNGTEENAAVEKAVASVALPTVRFCGGMYADATGTLRLPDKEIEGCYSKGGVVLTPEEVRQLCRDAIAKGFNVIPKCDNPDKTGWCAGHAVE